MILNGSPRAPKSNSKRYAALFRRYCPVGSDYFEITVRNHAELIGRMDEYSDLLLVFPLYADSLPVGLLDFLKSLELHAGKRRPVVSVLVNCGFREYRQNETAVAMLRLFCHRHGYPFGAVLMLGSGEAILETPFRFLAVRKIRQLARAVADGQHPVLHTTLPLTAGLFCLTANRYWVLYGRRYGVSAEQMRTPDIEA